jgi:twitching motility protein PilT
MADFSHDAELDALVRQLNQSHHDRGAAASGGIPAAPGANRTEVGREDPIEKILAEVMRREATDLLLVSGSPPILRVAGRLVQAEIPPLEGEDIRALLAPHVSAHVWQEVRAHGSADFSLRVTAVAGGRSGALRFRVNLHRQRGQLAAAIRALPRDVPSLTSLGLPGSLIELVRPTRGLVLMCGPTGSGKTSTLAALVSEINRTRACHIITIEEPIEYEHRNDRAIVEQVEIGADAPSFATALRAALRQDPDVLLVGEMRDLETIAIALTAAETGHLVLSTLHTSDAAQAVHRIVDVFPGVQQAQIRQQLALALHAIVCQQLVPCADGRGRVPAVEVIVANPAVRQHIRAGRTQNLHTEITLGKRGGMIALEESLARLVQSGAISREEARIRATYPEELESILKR